MVWVTRDTLVEPNERTNGRKARFVSFWSARKPYKDQYDTWVDPIRNEDLVMNINEFERYFDISLAPGEIKSVKLTECEDTV